MRKFVAVVLISIVLISTVGSSDVMPYEFFAREAVSSILFYVVMNEWLSARGEELTFEDINNTIDIFNANIVVSTINELGQERFNEYMNHYSELISNIRGQMTRE